MKETLLDWLGTFWKVLITPTPQTFLREAKKADGKFGSAVIWLVLYAIYIYMLASFVSGGALGIPTLLTLVCLIPLAVVLFTAAMNFICQRMFRQKVDHYDALLYIIVAVLLPVSFIFTPLLTLASADIFKMLSFILLLYQVVLLVISVKTIVNIEYWQALVTVTLSIIVGIIIGAVLFILIVSTISPPGLKQK